MKTLISIAVSALIFSFFIISCSGGPATPEGTAEKFVRLVEQGDNSAVDLMAPEVVQLVGRDKLEQSVQEQSAKFKEKGGVSSVEVTEKNIMEDKADLKVKINFGDGTSDFDNMNMIHKDGKWLITVSK